MTSPALQEKAARRRTVLIASAVAASVLLVSVGVGFALLAHRPARTPVAGVVTSGEASENATPSGEESQVSTGTGQPLTSTTTVVTDDEVATHPGTIVRSPKIAFRLGGQIFVANEDGTQAKAVYRSQSAPFALAPDASALAVAPPTSGGPAVLVDTASGRSVAVTGAVDLPAWAPDSSWLAYTAKDASGTFSVRRIAPDGTGDALLTKPGAAPQISPDSSRVAFVKTNQSPDEDPLSVLAVATRKVTTPPRVGGKRIAKANGALDFAWSPSGALYFAQTGGSADSGYVGLLDKSLGSGTKLTSLPTTPAGLAPDDLAFSPDGKHIVLTENGDDGYSRLVVVDVAGKRVSSLSTRRDAYPLRWTVDGKAILYIEGNAIQMEKTSLYRINPDGTRRLMVVSGAGL